MNKVSLGKIKYLLWSLVILAAVTGFYLLENLMTSLHQAAVIAIRPIKDGVSRDLKVEDIRYSPLPNAFIDVYSRPSGESNRPVFVFVHGGFYQGGFRRQYRHLGGWAHRQGFIAVLVDYPAIHGMFSAMLASDEEKLQRDYFAQENSIRDALKYIVNNAEQWGGDPDTLILSGHGTGGQLILSSLLDDKEAIPKVENSIKGMLLFSPIVDLTIDDPLLTGKFLPAAFGSRLDEVSSNSPMQNIRRFNFPILILSAENDLPYMTDTLARFQANSDNDIRLKITKGQSHQTLLFKLGRQTFDDTQTITQFSKEILKN